MSSIGHARSRLEGRPAVSYRLNMAGLDELGQVADRRGGYPACDLLRAEVGSIGLTEAQVNEKYGADNVEAYEHNLGCNGKSQILGTTGFIKLVREKDGPVVGVHMVGARVGELIGEG